MQESDSKEKEKLGGNVNYFFECQISKSTS